MGNTFTDAAVASSGSDTWGDLLTEVRLILEEPTAVVWSNASLLAFANEGQRTILFELRLDDPAKMTAEVDTLSVPSYARSALRDYILMRAFEQVGDMTSQQVYRNDYELGIRAAWTRAASERRVAGDFGTDVQFDGS